MSVSGVLTWGGTGVSSSASTGDLDVWIGSRWEESPTGSGTEIEGRKGASTPFLLWLLHSLYVGRESVGSKGDDIWSRCMETGLQGHLYRSGRMLYRSRGAGGPGGS